MCYRNQFLLLPLAAFAVILSEQEELTKGNDYWLFSPKREQYPTKNLENGFLKDDIKNLQKHIRKRYRTQKVRHFSRQNVNTQIVFQCQLINKGF